METPHRNLRADDADWEPCKRRARGRGLPMAVVMRASMRAYADGKLDEVLAPYIAADTPHPEPGQIRGQEALPGAPRPPVGTGRVTL